MKDAKELKLFHWSYQEFNPKLFLSIPSDKPKLTKKQLSWKPNPTFPHFILCRHLFSHNF